jgi:hypothetical protein
MWHGPTNIVFRFWITSSIRADSLIWGEQIRDDANRRSRVKGKIYPRRDNESPEGEQKYISSLSLTSALDGCWWSNPHTDKFTTRNENLYPLYRRLVRPQGRSARVRKSRPLAECDSRTVQPISSRSTDYTTPAHSKSSLIGINGTEA